MGNLTFIVPTENKDKNNTADVLKLLKDKFNQYKYIDDDNYISIRRKDDSIVTELFFKDNCYLIDYDSDIKSLLEIAEENNESNIGYHDKLVKLSEEMQKLKELNPDLNDTISMTYGTREPRDTWWRERGDIEFFLRDTFKAYLFDEGIHPEFMGPDYVRSKETKYKWYQYPLVIFFAIMVEITLPFFLLKEKYRIKKIYKKKTPDVKKI